MVAGIDPRSAAGPALRSRSAPPGSAVSAGGRYWSRSIRLSAIFASNDGTSPPCQESPPLAWLSPSRSCSARAAMASALALKSPLAENAVASGAAGKVPRSMSSAVRRASRSGPWIRTVPSNDGAASRPLTVPSNSALPRSPPTVASSDAGTERPSPIVPVASWKTMGRPRTVNVPSARNGPSSERAVRTASIRSIRSGARPSP